MSLLIYKSFGQSVLIGLVVYVPLLWSPVRDAAARLPNGEGTRAEICELLKDSQFLAPDVTSAQVRNSLLFDGFVFALAHWMTATVRQVKVRQSRK